VSEKEVHRLIVAIAHCQERHNCFHLFNLGDSELALKLMLLQLRKLMRSPEVSNLMASNTKYSTRMKNARFVFNNFSTEEKR
jgi:hypothetical protein